MTGEDTVANVFAALVKVGSTPEIRAQQPTRFVTKAVPALQITKHLTEIRNIDVRKLLII